MFKRANKITALLVAAASVMSIVPAMAADSTTSRLTSKDGHITNAVAFKDGKYVYQGYKSDDDTDSIYYNAGDKDKEISDISDATLNSAYQDKYAFANNGSDQYLVDLTSGTESDDTTPKDDIDTAATKLQTKLNKADRYKKSTSNISITAADLEAGQNTSDEDTSGLYAIPGTKFGDTWYSYSVATDSSDATKYMNNGHLYGFTDGNGKYVDASYTANIYAYSTAEGKTVKIENYSNSADDQDSDSKLLATLLQQPVALAQDKDNIYALVTVGITDFAANAKQIGGTTTSAAASTPSFTGGVTTVRTYVQKISKAQGDQKDDAYLPKTVETYEVGNADGKELDCGDAKDAYSAISDATGVSNLTDLTQENVVVRTSNGEVKPVFSVNNGDLIAIVASSSNVKAETLKFKKDKVKFLTFPGYKDYTSTTTTGAVDAKTKFDAYILEHDSDDNVDLNNDSDTVGAMSYDIDVDGNVWVVADGKIYEYKDGGDMTKMYAVDSALDAISVYDANSIFTWEANGDIYTTVNEGKDTTTDTTTAPAVTKTGWDQLATGAWNFYDQTGAKVANKWINDGGVWYFLKADGTMATGWYNDNGTWYFLKSSGAMATGWVQDGGAWYYLNASGAMLANTTTPDGYFVGADGAWV
jgi:hypothetical protein